MKFVIKEGGDGKRRTLINKNLDGLRENVLDHGFNWNIVDPVKLDYMKKKYNLE